MINFISRKMRIIIVSIVLVILVILGVRFWSGEDSWICQNGEWVKHGNPSAPMPSEPCSGANINVPLVNQPPGEMMTVKVFFSNSKLDPEVLDCAKNFVVERTVPKTLAVARAALEELLAGPTDAEKQDGYFTSINSGVKIQSLIIEGGVAKVDFDEQLEFQVGGSCRVAAIASQIRETLKQFPTVEEVVISIDSRTEDILQP